MSITLELYNNNNTHMPQHPHSYKWHLCTVNKTLDIPCLTLSEVIVLTNEDIIIDSSSGHTDKFCKNVQDKRIINVD